VTTDGNGVITMSAASMLLTSRTRYAQTVRQGHIDGAVIWRILLKRGASDGFR